MSEMKSNKKAIVLGFVVASIFLVLWLSGGFKTALERSDAVGGSTQANPSAHDSLKAPPQTSVPDSAIPIISPDPEEQASYVKLFKEVMGWGKTPIAFYGKVVDEEGRSVSQADIKIIVSDTSAAGTTDYHLKSDGNGHFILSNVRGKGLSVYVSKNGYYSPSAAVGHFEYAGVGADYKPDPNRPEVFRLHKMGERVPLVEVRASIAMPRDGVPVDIDLLRGKVVPKGLGDIKVTAETGKSSEANGRNFPWLWTLEVPDGGLIAAEGEFQHLAPENGYSARYEVDYRKTSGEWKPRTSGDFYLRTRLGHYARLRILFVPSGDHYLVISGHINPDGSRNLEPDPERPIQVKTHRDGSVSLIYPKGYEPEAP